MVRFALIMAVWAALIAAAAPARAADGYAPIAAVEPMIAAAGDAFDDAGATREGAQLRARAVVAVAMFAAANGADPQFDPFLDGVGDDKRADPALAARFAAVEALRLIYGDAADAPDPSSDLNRGIRNASRRLGAKAARAAFARGDARTAEKTPPYKPFAAAGVYVPTTLPVIPHQTLDVVPWVLDDAAALRAPGPTPLESKSWVRDFNEVKTLGGKISPTRTAQQTREATFWRGLDFPVLVEQLAERRGWSVVETTRLYALLSVAVGDALHAGVDSKFHFAFWRPITAIRRAELDPHTETMVDLGWEPLIKTPGHPEYPCGHCIYGAAIAAVLNSEVVLEDGETLNVYDRGTPDDVETIASFNEYSERMSMSRLYGGVHFRTSNQDGEAMGRAAAALAIERFAPRRAED